jgi:hypothetical protein
MIIIWFNIIKFDDHGRIMLQDCDHPYMIIIMKMIWNGINNYNHGCHKMALMMNYIDYVVVM